MFPVLLDLNGFKIYTFGFFLVIAILWSSYLLFKNIKLTSYKEEELFDSLIVSSLYGILVGRIVFIIFNLDYFRNDIFRMLLLHAYPGVQSFAVLITFILYFYYTCYKKKLSFQNIIDLIIPPLFAAVAIIKLGSLFAGNVIGAQTHFFLHVHYQDYEGLRHIVALYEAIIYTVSWLILQQSMYTIRRGKLPKMFTLWLGIFIFSSVNTGMWFLKEKAFAWYINSVPMDLVLYTIVALISFLYSIYTVLPFFKKLLKK